MSGSINKIAGNDITNLSRQASNNLNVQQTNNVNTKIVNTKIATKREDVNRSQGDVKLPSPKELKRIIDKINENVSRLNKDVKFSYNEAIKSLVVKVIDAKTGRVIREIPPQEIINLQKKLSEVVGIIFDSKEVER